MRRAIEVIIFTACLLAALVLPEQACLAAAGEPHAVLPKGTVLTLKLQEEISSDTVQSGDEVNALLLGEVAIDGVPILVSRTPAEAEITHVHGSGVYGHSGTLTVEVRAIRALNGVVISLEGEKSQKVANHDNAWTQGLVGGLFIKGAHARYRRGTVLHATVAEDTDLGMTVEELQAVYEAWQQRQDEEKRAKARASRKR
ncbi:MAG: hypothetical protein SPL46_07810 [Selenomonadaceae bacterium]|jgi:exosome complex RNA-binding protein Csl4|nr:hypothetical protein [Selenomonadaceae bacterium]